MCSQRTSSCKGDGPQRRPCRSSLDWYEFPAANLAEDYLFPETENEKCPINKNMRKHTCPNYDQTPQNPPPPPAQETPAQPMDTSGQHAQQQAPPTDAAPLCAAAAAAAMHPAPQTSSPARLGSFQNCSMGPSKPMRVSGNLWNLSLREKDIACQGPLGSFVRHTTSMYTPNVPHYVVTQKFPVKNLSDLRQEPTIENIIAPSPFVVGALAVRAE